MEDSPAIDAGNPAGCTDHQGNLLATDQRGAPRAGRCDIGAYEYTIPGPPAMIMNLGGTDQRTAPNTFFDLPFKFLCWMPWAPQWWRRVSLSQAH